MPLPDLIEIVPLDKPVQAEIAVPGAKSITNRALILAALAEGETTLQGALWSEDTQVMVEALRQLGFEVKLEPDPEEFCNRTIAVKGRGGRIPKAGTAENPLELFVGNAGTAARFLAALVCLGRGAYRLHGTPRMHERPQQPLFKALRELGYLITSANDRLPALISGSGPRAGKCLVNIDESSQFASALILCSIKGRWQLEITGKNAEEAPYVRMTDKLLAVFPARGGTFQIEPDASSGSYFLAAAQLAPAAPTPALPSRVVSERAELAAQLMQLGRESSVSVIHWPASGWQVDERFPIVLRRNTALYRGLEFLRHPDLQADRIGDFRGMFESPPISRNSDLGDGIMTAVVIAAFSVDPVRFTDLGRLRVQECERVVALRTELTRCGAKVIEEGDTLTVYPSELHGAEIETYNDHRMAMCFAILGLKIPGIKVKNPACVKKTFPNFFQKLAAAPPRGLGATIRDARTGRALSGDELFAD